MTYRDEGQMMRTVVRTEAPSNPPQNEVQAVINLQSSKITDLRDAIDALEARLKPVVRLRDTIPSEPDAIGHQRSSSPDSCIITQMIDSQVNMLNVAIGQVHRLMEDLRV